jgi:hypothetical protein
MSTMACRRNNRTADFESEGCKLESYLALPDSGYSPTSESSASGFRENVINRPCAFLVNVTYTPCSRSWGASLRSSLLKADGVFGQSTEAASLATTLSVSLLSVFAGDAVTLTNPPMECKKSKRRPTGDSSIDAVPTSLRLP